MIETIGAFLLGLLIAILTLPFAAAETAVSSMAAVVVIAVLSLPFIAIGRLWRYIRNRKK